MSFTILGTGSALPPHVIANDDFTKFLDTSDEWITTRTGIKQRHVLQGDETVTQLAAAAAKNALENANTAVEELDFILCATIGGDYISPSLACTLQEALGADCPALDVNGACAGFIYAMQVAEGLFATGRAKRVLLMAGEGLTRIADYADRATCVLFGDGAAGVVLAPGDDLLYLNLASNAWREPLYIPYPAGNCPGANPKEPPYIVMNGQEVYKFAVNTIAEHITKALDATGIQPEEVNHVLLHQANLRIIEAAQRKLNIPKERYAINIMDTGNISAVTIPLLLDECNRAGKLKSGDIIVMSGFGAGLVTGTSVIRWS